MLSAKRPLRVVRRLGAAVAIAMGIVVVCGSAQSHGQGLDPEPTGTAEGGLSAADEARLQLLSDPEAMKKGDDGKDKTRPPIEIYRSQIAPNDVIPWLKPNQWSSLSLDLQSNEGNYEGMLQSLPVALSARLTRWFMHARLGW